MVTVRRSTIVDAPAERVWALLRDFNGHDGWHPAVMESRLEGDLAGDEVGAVRRFRLSDGAELREQLLTHSDAELAMTYCILDAPLPLYGYVAEMRLKPVTDGQRTFWEWCGRFQTPPGQEQELATLVRRRIYDAGFAAVKRRFREAAEAAGRPRILRQGVEAEPSWPAPAVVGGAALEGQGIRLSAHGGPEVLRPALVQAPPPGPGELRLRQTAVGINFIDVYCRTGYFPLLEPGGVPGVEAAGEIVDVGPGVSGFSAGDCVAYACLPPGAYASVRTLSADLVVPLPPAIDARIAAAALLKGMTAEFLLHRVHPLKEGETVLVHAAAGGAGHLLCQWARAKGATVIAAVGNPEKAGLALRSGASTVVTGAEDLVARVMQATGGRGCDVVFDGIGGANLQRSFDCLAVKGHIVSFGQAAGAVEPFDVAGMADRSARLSRPNYGHYAGTPAEVQRMSANLFAAIERGSLDVHIGLELPLREAAEAHRRLEGRQTQGCLLLLP